MFFFNLINIKNITNKIDNIKIIIQFNLKKNNNNNKIINKNNFCNNIKYFFPCLSSSFVYLAMIMPIIKPKNITIVDKE